MVHAFTIGDSVALQKAWDRSTETTFEVVRLLPMGEDGVVQYHVKNADEKHARCVWQDQLQHHDVRVQQSGA